MRNERETYLLPANLCQSPADTGRQRYRAHLADVLLSFFFFFSPFHTLRCTAHFNKTQEQKRKPRIKRLVDCFQLLQR